MKGKSYNQEYSTQQGSHSDLMERSKALTEKQKLSSNHQTRFTTNAKRTSVSEKEKATAFGNKKIMK